MELRHLRYFVAVAEELNFARAARRVHIAQPSLTKQIQQLEQDLGFPLLYRTKKKVELLDTGHVFLDEAQRLLRQADSAIQSARRIHTGESGRLVIGFSPSAAAEVLPRILRRYHASYPKVIVDLLEILSTKNTESLLESALSVALLRSPTFLSRELFCFETIQHERFVVALPDSHPLAKQKSVQIKSLASEPLIVPPFQPGWGYADSILLIFRDYGIAPRIAQEATGAVAVVTLVAGGFGVALVPASLGNFSLPGVTYRSIKGPCRTSDLTVVWRCDSRASTVRAFLEAVRREYPGACELKERSGAESAFVPKGLKDSAQGFNPKALR